MKYLGLITFILNVVFYLIAISLFRAIGDATNWYHFSFTTLAFGVLLSGVRIKININK